MAGTWSEQPTAAADAYERDVGAFMRPVVAEVVARAGLERGQRVLDVACGTGLATRRIAEAVGPDGWVVGLDLSPGMLAVATAAVPGTPLVRGSGTALPWRDGAWDAVVCQQGLQFFPDPAAGAREARRVLAPGGRYVASVWSSSASVPLFEAEASAMSDVLGPESVVAQRAAVPDDGEAWLRDVVGGAGFAEVSVEGFTVTAVIDDVAAWIPRHLAGTPWGSVIDLLEPGVRAVVVADTRDRLGGLVDLRGTATLPFGVVVVVAVA